MYRALGFQLRLDYELVVLSGLDRSVEKDGKGVMKVSTFGDGIRKAN